MKNSTNINQLEEEFLQATVNLSDETFLQKTYHTYLRREPDEVGKQGWLNQLREGKISRQEVLNQIQNSPEYKSLSSNKTPDELAFIKSTAVVNSEVFLQEVYRNYLKREPDKAGKHSYISLLEEGKISRQQVIDLIRESPEYLFLWKLGVEPGKALHIARVLMVQNELPPAEIIVDLGGAADGYPQGALLLMGYPHKPKKVTIIDLPIDRRLGDWKQEEPKFFNTLEGTFVSYVHGTMADLSFARNSSVDMVFSGETIEHVSETDADRVMQEAYRILKPGGYFCLDTPNRALTRLHSPNELTHPEHHLEYLVHQLVEKLQRHNFNILTAKAICPMPKSLATGNFDWLEMAENICLSDKPEEGYLFFIKCQKKSTSV